MTLSECRITLGLRRYDNSEESIPVVCFSTVREFRAFQYALQVDCIRDDRERTVKFTIRGVSAPANIMPSSGSARCDNELRGATGRWRIELVGARQKDSFEVEFAEDGIKIIKPPADEKIELEIDEEVEIVRL